MAAVGLCAALCGGATQIGNAAEIMLGQYLSITCDSVKGLVQVPRIERNELGPINAVSAASNTLRGDGVDLMPLDACIKTVRQTGQDMGNKQRNPARRSAC